MPQRFKQAIKYNQLQEGEFPGFNLNLDEVEIFLDTGMVSSATKLISYQCYVSSPSDIDF